jgi:hypothetical protein
MLSNDQGCSAMSEVAQKVPGTAVALGKPQVTRLHHVENTTEQRALVSLASVARDNITSHPLRRCIAPSDFPRERAHLTPSPPLESLLTGCKIIALDHLALIAAAPGLALPSQLRDQRYPRVGTIADQGGRGGRLALFAGVVNRAPDIPTCASCPR